MDEKLQRQIESAKKIISEYHKTRGGCAVGICGDVICSTCFNGSISTPGNGCPSHVAGRWQEIYDLAVEFLEKHRYQINELPKPKLIYDNPANKPRQYDYINPDHYKKGDKEVWEMMVEIWGKEAFIKHCEMCAFKYRMRLGEKPEQPVERDLAKAKWYEDKAKELRVVPTFKIEKV